MNWQEELSRNARDPAEAERERKLEEERKLREHTNEMANDVWNELKQEMLTCVQAGNYKREYNKGIVECSREMPMYYMDDHVTIRGKNEKRQDYHNLQIDPEYAKEYALLNEALDKIVQENNAQFAWYYKVDDSSFETEFPSRCEFIFPKWSRRGQLMLRVISHFPIDPRYPIDYMSQEDLQDLADKKESQLNAMVKFWASQHERVKKDLKNALICMMLCVPIYLLLLYMRVEHGEFKATFFFATVFVVFLLFGTVSEYNGYLRTKEKLEDARQQAELELQKKE